MAHKIAICITTYNRPDVLLRGLQEQMKHLPVGVDVEARIFIVDDGSNDRPDQDEIGNIVVVPNSPFETEYFRFTENKGIAAAKNKCLEMADNWGADHIFLFDSDTWPKVDDWWKPYVESKEPHLMYIFTKFATDDKNGHNLRDCVEIYRDSEIVAYNHVRGCLLYIDRKVLEAVGGFDTRYGKAMFEHSDWSNRIHNAGLTSFRIMDVLGSNELIYSMDEHRAVASSIAADERRNGLLNNRQMHTASLTSSDYCDYGEGSMLGTSVRQAAVGMKRMSDALRKKDRNVILTNFFTSTPDFQRKNTNWKADMDAILPLKTSVAQYNREFVLLHDCFDLPNKVECTIDPYFNRIYRAWEYLKNNPDIDKVFMVDATDVIILNDPFPHMEYGKIYVGDEPTVVGNRWMLQHTVSATYRRFLMNNQRRPLMNIGILGGSRSDVMQLLQRIFTHYCDNLMANDDSMVIFNYLCYTEFKDKIVHGTGLVNNQFKSFKPTAERKEWFNHK